MDDLQQDLNKNLPSSKVNILAINEVGEDSANDVAAALSDLPLLQDTRSEDVWGNWDVTWRDVQVVDTDGVVTDILNLTSNDIDETQNYDNLKSMIVNAATSKRTAASPHQNRIEPLDTTKDGFVAPNDVLAVINRINGEGAGELPATNGEPDFYFDVSGDNHVSALDALRIIQVLNRLSRSGSGEPPAAADVVAAGEPPSSESVDAIFALNAMVEDAEDEDEEVE